MPNNLVTTSWVIREASVLLDNNLIGKKMVYTDYSDEFTEGRGETVTMKLPNSYIGRTTMTMAVQDTDTGSVPINIDRTAGVDITFTDRERTFSVVRFREEILVPAMRTVANIIDRDIWAESNKFWNWTGTAGTTVDGWDDVARAAQRLEEGAVPDPKFAVLTPADKFGFLNGARSLPNTQPAARDAYEDAEFTRVAGMAVASTQNLPALVTGTRVNGAGLLTNGANQTTTWAATRTTQAQNLVCDGFGANATVRAGEVFTLGTLANGVLAVNPVPGTSAGKPSYDRLQQFVVNADATADGSGNITLNISPPIIPSGAYQTVQLTGTVAASTDNVNLVFQGAASTTFRPSLAMHRNAIAFVNRPLVMPEGVTDCARETYKGLSMRFCPVWDGINSVGRWRFDVAYGVRAIRPDLGTRLSGA